MVELNPQIGRELKVVATSADLTTGLLAFAANCSAEIRRLTINSSGGMHENPQGQHILELFGMQQVVPFQPEYLDGVASLVEEYEQTAVRDGSTTSGRRGSDDR